MPVDSDSKVKVRRKVVVLKIVNKQRINFKVKVIRSFLFKKRAVILLKHSISRTKTVTSVYYLVGIFKTKIK